MQMLQQKAVVINGQPIESMQATANVWDALEIHSGRDILLSETIEEVKRKKRMIVLFNKPKGFTVSKEDKHNKTIYELLPKSWQKDFYYIGRLDKDSHGLLLLTNDPALVDYYEKPENKIYKVYEVQIDKPLKTNHIQKMKKGALVDENGVLINTEKWIGSKHTAETLKALNVRYQEVKNKHYAVVTLTEWKKRHIRRLFKALWYTVKDLMRVKVGKYQLGTIKPGKYMLQPYKESHRD